MMQAMERLAQAREQSPPADGLPELLGGLCQRLARVLEEENADLRNGSMDRLAEHARRKDMLQLDIMRLMERGGDQEALRDLLREELQALRAALDENARLLELHLGAAREFARHVEETIRDHASDGTYAPGSLLRGGSGRGYGAW